MIEYDYLVASPAIYISNPEKVDSVSQVIGIVTRSVFAGKCKVAEAGMKSVDLPYRGSYSFGSTEMFWPINHMVAPAGMKP